MTDRPDDQAPGSTRGKYDIPAKPADDFAIDALGGKTMRGRQQPTPDAGQGSSEAQSDD
ncbi:MAG: hypothetical protein AAF919_10750 [Pseudomonadota bacterium]